MQHKTLQNLLNLSWLKHQFKSPWFLPQIEDVNTADKRIASRLKIEQTAKALQEARVRVQLLEEEHALAVQEDLAIASAATSSPQLGPDESVLKDVVIRISL